MLSHVILFIDVLKFIQGKTGSLSASKRISYLQNMQQQGCYLVKRTICVLYLRDNPAVELMILLTAIFISSSVEAHMHMLQNK